MTTQKNGLTRVEIAFEQDCDGNNLPGTLFVPKPRGGPFLGMLPGHLYRLQKAVSELKNPSCVSTINRVPIIQLNGNTTATDGGTENDGPAG